MTDSEKFLNRQLRQREKELSSLPKVNVGKKRSSIRSSLKFRLPETQPPSFDDYWDGVVDQWILHNTPLSGPSEPPLPAPLFDYERDFPPLSKSVLRRNLPPITPKTPLPSLPSTPTETSFFFPAEESVSPLRKKLPIIAPLPSRPNINDFARPITDITHEKNNTISITPKKAPLSPIGQKQLSQELNKIFPDVDDTIKEKADTFKERNLDIDELVEKVGRAEKSEAAFEFEFFAGGENSKFNSFVKRFGLTTENMDFIDFLQSEYCKEILQQNDLKIHIETGNIYYDDKDTNESIFEFIQNRQNNSKGIIRNDFKFDGNYKDYFQWILNEFNAQEKTTFDVFSHQNTKFLVHRYNDFRESGGDALIKIRHTLVTDNYVAAEEIQNQDWQYFIERVIEVCKFSDVTIKPGEEFLLSTIENVTVAKKVYTMVFNTIARNFNLTIPNLAFSRIKDISDDFSIKNYSYQDSLTNFNDWIFYYYLYGKFPGSDEFVNVPYHKKPYFLKTETQLSPSNLYGKFSATTAKGLVSLHALCALNIYFGGNKDISKLAYGELNISSFEPRKRRNIFIF